MAPDDLFSASTIEAEYQRLGHSLGWRLLTCPARNIATAKIALITTNPGGREPKPPLWALDTGSAYVDESWKCRPAGEERLQRQVRRMFELMEIAPDEVLSGYLVPFRSRDWNSLPEKAPSLDFGMRIWRAILERARPQIVIAFGKDIAVHVVSLLGATSKQQHKSGWGEQTIDTFRFGSSGKLIVLPHLSRFALFNRPDSEGRFCEILNGSNI
ncbi:MAG TPA: uracil-DNA glycosylase family protein [Rhizomicrobium sp.]|jgi:hypothetical protein